MALAFVRTLIFAAYVCYIISRNLPNVANRTLTSSPTLTGSFGPESNDEPQSSSYDADHVDGAGRAMTRRLEQATEDALLSSDSITQRTILHESGFSTELKQRLLDRIATADFQSGHASALAQASLPGSAPASVRSAAVANAWDGEESTVDAVRRMLEDVHKPLRGGGAAGMKTKSAPPEVLIDLRPRREAVRTPGERVAGAREMASAYADLRLKNPKKGTKDSGNGLGDDEREAVRKEFRERFAPGARVVPATIEGLASLANQRIEDAIARGQFKNIPRGTGVERDRRADNPFIDTVGLIHSHVYALPIDQTNERTILIYKTEYLMNKMIQRQNLTPPWIEKQQELSKAVAVFRSRIRADWKRHAARLIASGGGTLQDKVHAVEAFARAEEAITQRRGVRHTTDPDLSSMVQNKTSSSHATSQRITPEVASPKPFRDPAWEAAEFAYNSLAIESLNTLARSYNLMAPDLAKKPYLSLERELRACFADVAPTLAEEIRARAATKEPVRGIWGSGGVFNRLGGSPGAGAGRIRMHESTVPKYGFRELWRDWWKGWKGRG